MTAARLSHSTGPEHLLSFLPQHPVTPSHPLGQEQRAPGRQQHTGAVVSYRARSSCGCCCSLQKGLLTPFCPCPTPARQGAAFFRSQNFRSPAPGDLLVSVRQEGAASKLFCVSFCFKQWTRPATCKAHLVSSAPTLCISFRYPGR